MGRASRTKKENRSRDIILDRVRLRLCIHCGGNLPTVGRKGQPLDIYARPFRLWCNRCVRLAKTRFRPPKPFDVPSEEFLVWVEGLGI